AAGLRGVARSGRHAPCTLLRELGLDHRLMALERLAQAIELRPVCGEADPEDADARGCALFHWPSACAAAAACRRASALRSRARARRYRSRAFGTITLARRRPPTTMFWSWA